MQLCKMMHQSTLLRPCFKRAAKTALAFHYSRKPGNSCFRIGNFCSSSKNSSFTVGNASSRFSVNLVAPSFWAGNLQLDAARSVSHPANWRYSSTSASSQPDDQVKTVSDVPGPKPIPVMGNLLYFLTNKEFDKEDVSKIWYKLIADYGPIAKLKFPGLPLLVVTTNPDDVETFLKSTMDNPTRIGFTSIRKLRLEEKNNFFNQKSGLLTENGEEWWRLRSLVQGPLLRPRNVTMYLSKMDEVVLKFMDRIELLQRDTGRVPDDFVQELHKWALESIALVALNTELGGLEPHLPQESIPLRMLQHAHDMAEAMTVLEFGGTVWWRFFRTPTYVKMETAHAAALEIAVEAMEEAEGRLKSTKAKGVSDREMSILEIFLNTEGLSRSDVATMVLDLLMGGIETTALTVGYALYLLARNPEVQKRIQQNVDAVVKRDEPLTSEHIIELTSIAHVVKETLRLYPAAFANARVLTRDAVLSGYKIPVGTFTLGLSAMTSRMEKYFPRSLEFLPERWQRDRPHGDIHPFASLPFSHGTRMCIGKRLAEQEIYTFLIRVLQRYTVTYEHPEELVVKTQLVSKPVTPLAFKFHPRR